MADESLSPGGGGADESLSPGGGADDSVTNDSSPGGGADDWVCVEAVVVLWKRTTNSQ